MTKVCVSIFSLAKCYFNLLIDIAFCYCRTRKCPSYTCRWQRWLCQSAWIEPKGNNTNSQQGGLLISWATHYSIYSSPLNIVWSVFNSIMLMFCNVGLLIYHMCFKAKFCRSSLWSRDSNRRNCAWTTYKVDHIIGWPVEWQMQALHDVVQAGYVRYIGMSSCWAWQCMWSFWSLC